LPSSADLDTVRNGPPVMTIASVVTDLKAGGDKAKITWLAACGLEFPEVPGKLIEAVPGTDHHRSEDRLRHEAMTSLKKRLRRIWM